MKIQSILLEDNLPLFDEDLSHYSKDILSHKQIKKSKKGTFAADCCLKLSCDLCLIKTQFTIHKNITDKFEIEGDCIQVSCLIKGESKLANKHSRKNLELGKVYMYNHSKSSEVIKMPPVHTQYICILISRNFYRKLLKNEKWATEDFFYQDVMNKKSLSLREFSIPLEFQLYQVMMDIMNCDWTPDKEMSYVKIKIKELFLQLHYQNQKKIHPNYTEDCVKKIKKARAYLAVNYDHAPTIKALSRIVLLNEVQLKSGFKDLYGETIKSYVTALRMKQAYVLLPTHSVNETAGMLGYKSVSHFISTFKKFHGQTPKQLLGNKK